MTQSNYTPRLEQTGTHKQLLGEKHEALACAMLQEHGLKLLRQNFSCRLGEIDLIMQDEATLVFVEVRYRRNSNHGGAAASITRTKQKRIIRTALFYQQKHAPNAAMRFDAVTIDGDNDPQWICSAFDGF